MHDSFRGGTDINSRANELKLIDKTLQRECDTMIVDLR
jgi:hypothetical protein